MIATANPDPADRDETCRALKFAALASEIDNTPRVKHSGVDGVKNSC